MDALFQVSDSAQSVEEGEIHGKMKVETLGDDGITMSNDGSISLGRGKIIEIMENLRLEVADSAQETDCTYCHKDRRGKDTYSKHSGRIGQ